MNKNLNISNYFVPLLLLFISISIQILLLKKIGRVEVIVGLNSIVITTFLLLFVTKKYYNILIIIYFLPLIFLNNSVHYQLKYELLFALPLFALALFTLLTSILNPKRDNGITNLSKPTLIFMGYYLLNGILGKIYGNNSEFIFIEGFHFLLFGSIILFSYNLTSRDDYFIIFKSLLIIFLLISIEYIFLGSIISGKRFVTFQSGFLPFVSGILFSLFLLSKDEKMKVIYLTLIIVAIVAMISTLTRTLWVTTIITLLAVYILYLQASNRLTWGKKLFIMLFAIISVFSIIKTFSNTKSNDMLGNSEKVEERAQSIANPTEDHSFLMRVEMGWYALQKIGEKPLFGWGLGDYLKYQFLGNNQLKNKYIDNSWFYFLWKGGILGFLLIVFIFYRSIKIGFNIISLTENIFVKALVIGIIAGTVGIIMLGFLSPLVIKYRTNVLFTLIWAYLEFEYNFVNKGIKKLSNEDIDNHS